MTAHRWSKTLSPQETAFWEEQLQLQDVQNWVLLDQPGTQSELQVYLETEAEAKAWEEKHGGMAERLKEENWAALSVQSSTEKVIRVRKRMLVTLDPDPEFAERLRTQYPDRLVLHFPPGLAFGTGDHATTSTCLRMLVDLEPPLRARTWSQLDLGTGTGILAIAGFLLGARPVVACDHDPKAIQVTRESCLRHGVEVGGIDVIQSDLLKADRPDIWKPNSHTLVTANLFSMVLLELLPRIAETVEREGWVILSGILPDQSGPLEERAAAEGLQLVRRVQRGRWVSLLYCSPKLSAGGTR